jgi:light-regulated signal transduction histidine kinase (bacteriophytochrome)
VSHHALGAYCIRLCSICPMAPRPRKISKPITAMMIKAGIDAKAILTKSHTIFQKDTSTSATLTGCAGIGMRLFEEVIEIHGGSAAMHARQGSARDLAVAFVAFDH